MQTRLALGLTILGFALAPASAQAVTVISPQPNDSTRVTQPVFTFTGAVDPTNDGAPFGCVIDGLNHQPTPCDSGWKAPAPLANGTHTFTVFDVADQSNVTVTFTIDPASTGVTGWALTPPAGGTPPPPGTGTPPAGTPPGTGAPPGVGTIIGPDGTPIYNAPSRVAIISRHTHVNPAGRTAVKMACGAGIGSCSGTLTLTKRLAIRLKGSSHTTQVNYKLGTGKFTIASGQTATVSFPLSLTARRLLRRVSAKALVIRSTATSAANTSLAYVEYSLH